MEGPYLPLLVDLAAPIHVTACCSAQHMWSRRFCGEEEAVQRVCEAVEKEARRIEREQDCTIRIDWDSRLANWRWAPGPYAKKPRIRVVSRRGGAHLGRIDLRMDIAWRLGREWDKAVTEIAATNAAN